MGVALEIMLVAVGDLRQGIGVAEIHAVVDAGPQPAECPLEEPHEGRRIVGGDFIGELAGADQALAPGDLLLPHFLRDCGAYRAHAQDTADDGPAVGQVRTDARRALPRVADPQGTRDPAALHHGRSIAAEQAAQRDRLIQFEQRVAPVEYHLEEAAHP